MINLEEIRKLKEDVYGYNKRFEGLLIKLQEEPINEESKISIKAYLKDYIARGNTTVRALKYGYSLKKIALLISDKIIHKLNREEITDLVLKIQSSELKKRTQEDLLLTIKLFYKFIKKTENYPEEVSWIKIRHEHNIITKDDLITKEEYKKMYDNATDLKDKTLIALLHETGCRIGELMTLTLERVAWEEENECYQLNVYGKTGFRVVPVIENTKLLKQYMETHEFKNNPKCTLFNVQLTNKPYSYNSLKKRLQKVLKRTGITKRIHPHLFRHTDITEKSGELSDQVMKRLYGWSNDSRMLDTYSHLTNKTVTLKLKELNDKKENKDIRLNRSLERIIKIILKQENAVRLACKQVMNSEAKEEFVKLVLEVSKYQKQEKGFINKNRGDLLLESDAAAGI